MTQIQHNANRILYVRNLPYNVTGDEIYNFFGKYGPIRQVRLGNIATTRATAYVVFERLVDAQAAKDCMNGFVMGNKYLIVQFHKLERIQREGQ